MRLSLDALEVLDAIDRHGSFAAAAKALHRVPSALSYSVQKLEQDLDVTIFDRRGHRAVLTEAGRELLAQGRHLLAAAASLEGRVRQVARGWEAELVIAVNDILPMAPFFGLCRDFYAGHRDTHLRLRREVLSGTWDALADGRADLAVGVTGDPPGGGYLVERLGEMDFLFVMAPDHPLAGCAEPLVAADRRRHRAVAAADSSRGLPARSVGLLAGQETLTVPDLQAKMAAQTAGLGVGYLPRWLVAPEIAAGRLVARLPEEGLPTETLFLACRVGHHGRALAWFRERLLGQECRRELFPPPAAP